MKFKIFSNFIESFIAVSSYLKKNNNWIVYVYIIIKYNKKLGFVNTQSI